MSTSAVNLVAGGLLVAIGFWFGTNFASSTTDTGSRLLATPLRGDAESSDLPYSAKVLDELMSVRLELKALRESMAPIPVRVAASPEPTFSAAEAKILALLDEIRPKTASIDELARLKPSPDFAALNELRRDYRSSPSGAQLLQGRIAGMDFCDVTRVFGAPTWKLELDDIWWPSGARITEWRWELSDENLDFNIRFEGTVAKSAGFSLRPIGGR